MCNAGTEGRCKPDPEAGEEGCPYHVHEPQTEEGELAFDVISGCGSQLRVGGMGIPFGLDFGTVMSIATARGANAEWVAELLPVAERVIVAAMSNEPIDDGGGNAE
jgi:hypothetical protein